MYKGFLLSNFKLLIKILTLPVLVFVLAACSTLNSPTAPNTHDDIIFSTLGYFAGGGNDPCENVPEPCDRTLYVGGTQTFVPSTSIPFDPTQSFDMIIDCNFDISAALDQFGNIQDAIGAENKINPDVSIDRGPIDPETGLPAGPDQIFLGTTALYNQMESYFNSLDTSQDSVLTPSLNGDLPRCTYDATGSYYTAMRVVDQLVNVVQLVDGELVNVDVPIYGYTLFPLQSNAAVPTGGTPVLLLQDAVSFLIDAVDSYVDEPRSVKRSMKRKLQRAIYRLDNDRYKLARLNLRNFQRQVDRRVDDPVIEERLIATAQDIIDKLPIP